jgi:hypothetical protein
MACMAGLPSGSFVRTSAVKERELAGLCCLYSCEGFRATKNVALIIGKTARRATQMMERMAGSPRRMARMTGMFYLLTILAGIFAQFFVSGRLVEFTDAAATAKNILTHKRLVRVELHSLPDRNGVPGCRDGSLL